jgi:hypothetical protein
MASGCSKRADGIQGREVIYHVSNLVTYEA